MEAAQGGHPVLGIDDPFTWPGWLAVIRLTAGARLGHGDQGRLGGVLAGPLGCFRGMGGIGEADPDGVVEVQPFAVPGRDDRLGGDGNPALQGS